MLTNLFSPVASGSATQSEGLARMLVKSGHRVIVITARVDSNSAEHEVVDGLAIYRLPAIRVPEMRISLNFPWLSWTFLPSNIRRMQAIMQSHGVNVLHVHNHMFDMAFSGALLRRRLGIPMVLTLHTVVKHSAAIFNLVLIPVDRHFLGRVVVRNADALIYPDFNIKDYAQERFSREDGALIPYGISLPPHPGDEVETAIRAKFGLDGRRVILSLGHVHALRNRLDLIRAMARVRERFPEVLLLIVGAVADQRPVELTRQLGLEGHVAFIGPQPYAHMPVYHGIAELEAMWLDQADGGMNSLGIAGMEAMFSGKPIITVANENTFGEGVLKSGRNVVIAKANEPNVLAETIMGLLADPSQIAAIGRAAKVVAGRFAWPQVTERTEEVYRSVVAKRASARIGR